MGMEPTNPVPKPGAPTTRPTDAANYSLIYSSDAQVAASGVVDLGLIPSLAKPMTLKLVFTASVLYVQH